MILDHPSVMLLKVWAVGGLPTMHWEFLIHIPVHVFIRHCCIFKSLIFFFRVRNGEFSLFFFPLPNRRQWGQRSTLVMHHFQQHETDLYPKLYFSIVKRSRVGMHELEVEMGTSFEGEQEYTAVFFYWEQRLSMTFWGFLRSDRVQGLQSAPCSPLDVPHSPYILIRKRNRKTQF